MEKGVGRVQMQYLARRGRRVVVTRREFGDNGALGALGPRRDRRNRRSRNPPKGLAGGNHRRAVAGVERLGGTAQITVWFANLDPAERSAARVGFTCRHQNLAMSPMAGAEARTSPCGEWKS